MAAGMSRRVIRFIHRENHWIGRMAAIAVFERC